MTAPLEERVQDIEIEELCSCKEDVNGRVVCRPHQAIAAFCVEYAREQKATEWQEFLRLRDTNTQIRVLGEQLAACQEALKTHGRHAESCALSYKYMGHTFMVANDLQTCTCGLDAALAPRP